MRATLPATLALLAACGAVPTRGPEAPTATAAQILGELRARGGSRQNLRALGRVTYFGDKGRVRVKTVFLVERPRRFRVETLSPLELPLDVLTSDGERLWILSDGQLHEGPATPENIARVLPLPIGADDLVTMFLGGVPLASAYEPIDLTTDGDRHHLRLRGPGGRPAELTVAADGLRVLEAQFGAPGSLDHVILRFDKFEALDGGESSGRGPEEFARAMAIAMPARKLELDVQLKSLEVNVALDPALFALRPPPGITPKLLPSPGAPEVAKPPDPGVE